MDVFVKTNVEAIALRVEPMPADAPYTADDLLTQSRMETFGLCQRKHQYRYVDGYDSAMPKGALDFGHAWHKFMEYWWANRRDPDELRERVIQPASLGMDRTQVLHLECMMEGYDLAHRDEFNDYRVLEIEKEFRAMLLDPSATTDGGKRPIEVSGAFYLAGKIDAIIQDAREPEGSENVIIDEHKTTKESIESDGDPYWNKLAGDHQLSIYVIGADSLRGYNAQEALYDVARKPSIKQKKAETLEEFRDRLRADMRENPKSYFRWRRVPRQTNEVFRALRDAWDIGRLIEIGQKGYLAPRNPGACFKYGTGHRCPFYNTCFLGTPLEENAELMRKAPFSELSQ
jgi:hypothetical protein